MRTILHSDINNCYASIECLHHPELRGLPVAVTGDPEARHGIILAKNTEAKRFGVVTGETIYSAERKCPGLVTVRANFPLYERFCSAVRKIYSDYTDMVEPFGMDEAWLDVTGSLAIFGRGEDIANAIRRRVKDELGITVSIGVSFNKVFAKLGSDLKKPNAVTVISPENFRQLIWGLDVSQLLFAGSTTCSRLRRCGLRTIGDVANASPAFLKNLLGKSGPMLHKYANGLDDSPVTRIDDAAPPKSIGNSVTTPRDIVNFQDAEIVLCTLCERVGYRLRKAGKKCRTVAISIKGTDLSSFERQMHLAAPGSSTDILLSSAMKLRRANWDGTSKIRALGIRADGLVDSSDACPQLSIFENEEENMRTEKLESALDSLRGRFGSSAVRRAVTIADPSLIADLPKFGSSIPGADHTQEANEND